MVEMEVIGVRVDMPSSSPIALLREREGAQRLVPIFIGAPEATAIAFALEEVVTPRPMTHDLLQNLLEDLGVSLEKVTITHLEDGVFFAELDLHAHDGVHTMSVRPSDAIALATRTGSPIYASDEILDEAGYLEDAPSDAEPDPDPAQSEEVVEQFRDFIDSVNPDDFAS